MRHYSVILHEDQIQALYAGGLDFRGRHGQPSRAALSARVRDLIDGHLYPDGVPEAVAEERAMARKVGW